MQFRWRCKSESIQKSVFLVRHCGTWRVSWPRDKIASDPSAALEQNVASEKRARYSLFHQATYFPLVSSLLGDPEMWGDVYSVVPRTRHLLGQSVLSGD